VIRYFLLLVLLLSAMPGYAHGIKEVTVCWEDGLKPPYLMLDDQQKPTGIAVQMLSEIFKSQQVRVKHVVRPWKRCLEQVKTNEVTLVPNASFTEERAAFSHYTKPLYETHLVLFYSKAVFPSAPSIRTLEELSKYRVIGISGFNYQRYQGKVTLEEGARNRETQNAMLRAGRGEFATEQLEVSQYLAKQGKLKLDGLGTISDPAQATQPFFILVSKAHPLGREITEMIDREIEELKRKGRDKKITAEHLQ